MKKQEKKSPPLLSRTFFFSFIFCRLRRILKYNIFVCVAAYDVVLLLLLLFRGGYSFHSHFILFVFCTRHNYFLRILVVFLQECNVLLCTWSRILLCMFLGVNWEQVAKSHKIIRIVCVRKQESSRADWLHLSVFAALSYNFMLRLWVHDVFQLCVKRTGPRKRTNKKKHLEKSRSILDSKWDWLTTAYIGSNISKRWFHFFFFIFFLFFISFRRSEEIESKAQHSTKA